MDINLAVETNKEIEEIQDLLLKTFPNKFKQQDTFCLTCKYNNKDYYLVFYPELLSYGYGKTEKCEVWICCEFEFEGDDIPNMFLDKIVETFQQINLTPFHDEDAYRGYWKKKDNKGWYKLSCYINPSYPEGKWENHTL